MLVSIPLICPNAILLEELTNHQNIIKGWYKMVENKPYSFISAVKLSVTAILGFIGYKYVPDCGLVIFD